MLRAIDKLDRLGRDGVRMLLGAGRKDESGDFTKGAGLTTTQIEAVLRARLYSPRQQVAVGDQRRSTTWKANGRRFRA